MPISARRTAIENYLLQVVAATLPFLPYDEDYAAWHASERARLSATGQMEPFANGQIAAIAQVNELVLVTFNVADYLGFNDICIEDWQS